MCTSPGSDGRIKQSRGAVFAAGPAWSASWRREKPENSRSLLVLARRALNECIFRFGHDVATEEEKKVQKVVLKRNKVGKACVHRDAFSTFPSKEGRFSSLMTREKDQGAF